MTTSLQPATQTPMAVAEAPQPGRLRFRVFPGSHLGKELTAVWSELQRSDPTLESPFFRPEFTQVVASVRDDVYVAVAFDGNEPTAFFPFQRRWKWGGPIGGPLTDYQGIIARPGVAVDPRKLLRACGLVSWRFNHLVASQTQFAPYVLLESESPCVDLSCGLPAYLDGLGKKTRQLFSAASKIQRKVGPLRMEFQSRDRTLLEPLIKWKTDQLRASRTPNIFDYGWARDAFLGLLNSEGPALSTSFTTLHFSDELAAVGLLLAADDVIHFWMTAYNRDYARYSPGLVLLAELLKVLPQMEVRCLDLGRGSERYKQQLANTATPLWEGVVERRPLTRPFRKIWLGVRERVRRSRFHSTIRIPWSWVRPLRDWVTYR